MRAWMVPLFVENGRVPSEPSWAEVFEQVAPIAQGLNLDPVAHAQTILATRGNQGAGLPVEIDAAILGHLGGDVGEIASR